MTNHKIQFVGSPCGHHGNYTFYKAFKYSLHGKQKILSLGEFFFIKIWEEEDIISIGEAQLLWEDRSSGQILVSLRIYFLPENTPEGRGEEHGEHEVVSLAEKVVLRADDVINIMRAASGVKWDAGLRGVYGPAVPDMAGQQDSAHYASPLSQSLDINEVLRERSLIGDVIESNTVHVIVLSYDSYCRMRALLKRLEGVEEETMRSKVVRALGGFVVPSRRTKLLFCRDVFDYPELEGHELLCNHLAAPKLQGRPRKKRRRPDSDSESSETSEDQKPRVKPKPVIMTKSTTLIPGLNAKPNTLTTPKISHQANALSHQIKNEFSTPALDRLIEVDFMSKLYKFMKDRNTAITRLPYIGYKQLNVFELFTRVQQLGGYEVVGQKKLWKHLYEDVVGKQTNQNAAQNLHSGVNGLKRHYERLLLPYENFLLQEQRRMLGIDSKKTSSKQQKFLNKHHKHHHHHRHHLSPSKPQQNQPLTQQPHRHTSSSLPPHVIHHHSNQQELKDDPGEPSVSILQVPKVTSKKESSIPADLAKRPEITITPIPRSLSSLGSGSLTPLQLADLMTLNVNLNSTLGVSALQDLAKIAERYDKAASEPSPKKHKSDDASTRLNGASQRNNGSSADGKRNRSPAFPESHLCKTSLPVPDLVSADFLRQINALDSNSKLLLPAHQSTKTINALAALLPQTSIFPAPAPAAHQHNRSVNKPQVDSTKPEPVFQSLSVYSQSKNIYGKPNADVTKESSKDSNRSSSPDIEILDLRISSENRNSKVSKNDRLEIELLDLSTRRDITVSAVPKPGPSRNYSSARIPPPQVSIKSTDGSKASSYGGLSSSAIHGSGSGGSKGNSGLSGNANHSAAAALASAIAAQGIPPALASLGMGSPAFLHYLVTSNMKGAAAAAATQPPPMFPYMDPATLASYYSLLPHGLLPPTSSQSSSGNAVAAAAAHQAAVAAQLAQLNSLGLASLPVISPEAMASLGIYKNYLPQGNLPPPHFLSGLMSPGGPNAPTSK